MVGIVYRRFGDVYTFVCNEFFLLNDDTMGNNTHEFCQLCLPYRTNTLTLFNSYNTFSCPLASPSPPSPYLSISFRFCYLFLATQIVCLTCLPSHF
jgi:hypothetical protein